MASIIPQVALAVWKVIGPHIKTILTGLSFIVAGWNGKRKGRSDAIRAEKEASRERTITRMQDRIRIDETLRRSPSRSRADRVRDSRWIERGA